MKSLKANDGKSLADKLALMIGNVGENATLKRALGIKVDDGIYLTGKLKLFQILCREFLFVWPNNSSGCSQLSKKIYHSFPHLLCTHLVEI